MGNGILRLLSGALDKLSIGMHALASLWMFFLIFLTTCDVAGRVLFNRPIPGVPEIIKVSLVFICFLLLPEATGKMRHIRSDVLVKRLGSSTASILTVIRFLLGTLLLIGIAIGTWDKMIEAWKIWEYEGEGTIRVPMAPVRTTILVCSLLAAFFSIRLLRKALKKLPRRPQ
jgi:TRAP-type C4-dicarboxylate transport system permease small subunit